MARSDQCENCTRLLDPTQLVDPRSAVSGDRNIEFRDSRHLYFLQSRLSPDLRTWINSHKDWPILTTSTALKWLDEGLEDRGITRDLEWGVPVEREGFEGKVYYVWFDAPIEYIGATKERAHALGLGDEWKAWWYDATDVRYVQFMAKDNLPFHTVMFPAMIMGTREPWKLADYIKGFNWLDYYGGKFSTSRRHGVFMDGALDILPTDYWRYFLIANAPESGDSTFTWEHFAATVNKDLADTLGNFVNRTLTFSRNRFGDRVPGGNAAGGVERELGEQLARLLAEYEANLDTLQFRKAAQSLRDIWSSANSYLEKKSPWLEIRDEPDAAALSLRTAMNLIFLFGMIAEPVIPGTASLMREVFQLEGDHRANQCRWPRSDDVRNLSWIGAGEVFIVPSVLFRKITEDDVLTWRERFGAEDID